MNGNFTHPPYIYDISNSNMFTCGSNIDANGDGLPDVVIQGQDAGGFYGATYLNLNTGKAYCIASENAKAKAARLAG
jgi:hypothetical protein